MQITKLEYQKKNPARVNVYVDGKFAVGLGANDIIKLGIYNGQEITQQDLQKIISESEFGKLYNSALNFLSYRPRSEWEVRFKLGKKHDEQEIDAVIEKLIAIKQIDDEAFCRWFIDQRTTFRPKGERALKYELAGKGIPKEIISSVFESQEKPVSDFQLALRVAVKKFGEKIDEKDKPRVQRFLASRGFNWDTIGDVLENVMKKSYNDSSI